MQKNHQYDIFQVYHELGRKRSNGTLFLRDRKYNSAIYFHEGKIIFAKTNNRKLRIGDLLVADEKVSREQVEEALIIQRQNGNGKRIGSILVEHFGLDCGVLQKNIRRQIIKVIEESSAWTDINSQFLENMLPKNEDITIDLSVENVILRITRRINDWKIIEAGLPQLDSILQIAPIATNYIRDIKLLPQEWNILPYVNGYYTLREIIHQSDERRRATCKILYCLLAAGIIQEIPQIHPSRIYTLEKKIDTLTQLFSQVIHETE